MASIGNRKIKRVLQQGAAPLNGVTTAQEAFEREVEYVPFIEASDLVLQLDNGLYYRFVVTMRLQRISAKEAQELVETNDEHGGA